MRTLLTVIVLLSLITIVVLTVNPSGPETKTMSLIFSKGDFPQYGLRVITPSDAAYDVEMSSALKRREPELRDLMQAAKPFSVFIENSSDLSLVGCSLEWRIAKTDGTVTNQAQSYSSPGVLMGMEPSDKAMVGHTDLINPHSSGLMSLDPHTKQLFDWRTKSLISLPALDDNERREFYETTTYLRQTYSDLLMSARGITVSIDGAIFSDGSFFGLDKNHLITETQSMVEAKYDLAREIQRDINASKTVSEIFAQVEFILKNPLFLLNDKNHSLTEEYRRSYSRYIQVHIQELLRMKEAQGGPAAISYSQIPLRKSWPAIRRKAD